MEHSRGNRTGSGPAKPQIVRFPSCPLPPHHLVSRRTSSHHTHTALIIKGHQSSRPRKSSLSTRAACSVCSTVLSADASGWSPWAERPVPITPILGLTFPPQHPAVQARPEKPEGECGPLGPRHLLAPPLLPPEGQGQQLSETCQVLTGAMWCPNQLNNQEGSLPLQLYHPALSGGTWEESRTQI